MSDATVSVPRKDNTTRWLLLPGIIWMALFLITPILMIVYVSFWTQTTFNISPEPTLDSWKQFFSSDTYIGSLWTTTRIWLIVLAMTFIVGYPTALFVGLLVKSKTLSTILLVICVIPFWTSFLIRVLAWRPMLGKEGAINIILLKAGIIQQPIEVLLFTELSVIIGMTQRNDLRMILDEAELPIRLPQEGIVMSAKLAEVLDIAAGQRLTVQFLDGERHMASVPVVRVIDEPLGVLAYMDVRALARLSFEPVTATGAYLAIDPQQQKALFRTLKEVPMVSSVTLREATLQSFLATVAENMRMNTLVLVVFACIIAFGVVYNSARIALSEHAIELASLRILGFTQAEVGRMLLGEQLLLTLAALPVGCLIGYGLSALLAALLSQELFRIPLVISRQTFAFAIGVVLAATAASAALVWRRVQRLDLIAVLKTRE
jgi:ABC-type spermidine/putrescine transport system permease subunit II